MTTRSTTLLAALVAASITFAPPPVSATAGAPTSALDASACAGSRWVGAWTASPSDAAHAGFAQQSLRMIIHPLMGGDTLRIRLSNRFGSQPVSFDRVYVGRRASGASLVPDTNRAVTFDGSRTLTIPPKEDVLSDAVALPFEAFTELAVSMDVGLPTGPATQHWMSNEDSYVTAGGDPGHAADEDATAFTRTVTSWFFVTGLEVSAPGQTGAVVAFGDSVTDGQVGGNSSPQPPPRGLNVRYPDRLARRLAALPGPQRFSVLNAGISGNQVTEDGFIPQFGPRAGTRLEHDVIKQPGVTDVIVMEGLNDIAKPLVPVMPANVTSRAQAVIEALDEIVVRLQGAGLNVFLGTLTPTGGTLTHGSPQSLHDRRIVNAWIRSAPRGVHVIDFDAAVRDPDDHDRLLPEYDSGDHGHPSVAGHQALAEAVDLSLFRGTTCSERMAA